MGRNARIACSTTLYSDPGTRLGSRTPSSALHSAVLAACAVTLRCSCHRGRQLAMIEGPGPPVVMAKPCRHGQSPDAECLATPSPPVLTQRQRDWTGVWPSRCSRPDRPVSAGRDGTGPNHSWRHTLPPYPSGHAPSAPCLPRTKLRGAVLHSLPDLRLVVRRGGVRQHAT
jgi:hypothetical protein